MHAGEDADEVRVNAEESAWVLSAPALIGEEAAYRRPAGSRYARARGSRFADTEAWRPRCQAFITGDADYPPS